jgi:hypothetical protein
MPQARKPAPRPSRPPAAFREPTALKQLSRPLDAAQDALAELRKDTGRDVGQGARDLYKDVRTFVSSARRDTGRLAKTLQCDFAQAQKRLGTTRTSTRPASAPSRARSDRSETAGRQPREARTPARAGAPAPAPARSAAAGRSPTRPKLENGVSIVLFQLGRCHGRLAYDAIEWYFPRHGQKISPGTYISACTGTY